MADAVVVPGRTHGPYSPLLWYAGEVATRRGAQVHHHEWTSDPEYPFGPHLADWVRDELDPLPGGTPLLVGKSLGSLAAGLAAERSLPAVWITPLLSIPWAVELHERATAPLLLVGGTADTEYWDGALARRLTPHVLEVEDADHGMAVPGPSPTRSPCSPASPPPSTTSSPPSPGPDSHGAASSTPRLASRAPRRVSRTSAPVNRLTTTSSVKVRACVTAPPAARRGWGSPGRRSRW